MNHTVTSGVQHCLTNWTDNQTDYVYTVSDVSLPKSQGRGSGKCLVVPSQQYSKYRRSGKFQC